MAISQNFKSTVVFGGRIDPSFKRSSAGLNDAIRQTGQTVGQLTKRQEKLRQQIAASKLAGRDISILTQHYQKLDRQIKDVTRDQEQLNKQIARQQRLDKWSGRSKGVARLAGAGLMWGGAGAATASFGLTGIAMNMNAQTAEKLSLARAYGVGIERFAAWENIAKKANLNGENVGDLSSELTNKIGKPGSDKELDPLLYPLGLSSIKMKGWNRERQFEELMNRLSNLPDEQLAASLGDELLGGEANKLVTFMKVTNKSWQEAMKEAEESNLLTQKNAEGATRAHFAIQNLWQTAQSGLADMAGDITADLEPEIKQMQSDLKGWFKKEGPEITKSISSWLKPDANGETGIQRFRKSALAFSDGLYKLGRVTWAVADKLSFLLPEGEEELQKSITEGLANGMPLAAAEAKARSSGLGRWWDEQAFNEDKVKAMRAARDSGRGGFDGLLELTNLKDRTAQKPIQVNNSGTTNIVVNAAPGQSAEEVGNTVYKKFDEQRVKNNYGLGAMYDTPIPAG